MKNLSRHYDIFKNFFMYWPVAQNKNICESLEEVIRGSERSSRAVEFVEKDDSNTSEEEEGLVNKKRTKSNSTQLKKKISISNIQQLNLSDHNLSRTQSFLGSQHSSEDTLHRLCSATHHDKQWSRRLQW